MKNQKILILESIHKNAVGYFEGKNFENIDYQNKALAGAELEEAIAEAEVIGIRSKTKLTKEVLEKAKKLRAIGAFCIGTNQIDLEAAAQRGVPVFNSPFSNTRSVAELVMAEIVMLARGIPEKNNSAHKGEWTKSAENSFEVRGKKLGIIGYGHIGSQVSVLAENFGMEVYYYDIENKLSIGNARMTNSLKEVLEIADFITLHVPATDLTAEMIGEEELGFMRQGSYLINASRGNVVVIPALAEALRAGKISGAAIDVFPEEPKAKGEEFMTELREFDNVLLTPHIGGATQEAQQNIALEVSEKLVNFLNNGNTIGAVNFPQVMMNGKAEDIKRICHIHKNIPGVMGAVNEVFAKNGLNVSGQNLKTEGDLGYVVIDIDNNGADWDEVLSDLEKVEGTIKVRIL